VPSFSVTSVVSSWDIRCVFSAVRVPTFLTSKYAQGVFISKAKLMDLPGFIMTIT